MPKDFSISSSTQPEWLSLNTPNVILLIVRVRRKPGLSTQRGIRSGVMDDLRLYCILAGIGQLPFIPYEK